MKYEIKAYQFGETIGKGFNLYFNNLLFLVVASLIFHAPVILFEYIGAENLIAYSETSDEIIFFHEVLFITATVFPIALGYVLLSGVTINIVSKKYLGTNIKSKDYFINMLPILLPLIGLGILESLILGVGSLLFIIPGIIWSLGFSLSAIVLIVEKKGIIDSLKRSWHLTRGHKGKIFGIFLVIGLIQLVIKLPFNYLIESTGLNQEAVSTISSVLDYILKPIESCILIIIYFNIRVIKEAYNLEHLTQQFSNTSDAGRPK